MLKLIKIGLSASQLSHFCVVMMFAQTISEAIVWNHIAFSPDYSAIYGQEEKYNAMNKASLVIDMLKKINLHKPLDQYNCLQ